MVDPHAATELKLYIDNDGNLYRQQTTSILKNLITKQARGEYKHDLAVGRGSTGHTSKKTPPAGHSTRRERPARYGHGFATAPRSRAQLDQEIKHAIGPQAYALYRGRR